MSTLPVTGGSLRRTAALVPLALLLVTPSAARADVVRIAADTTCLAGGTSTSPTRTLLTSSRIAARSTTEPAPDPEPTTSGTALGSANYREGKCRNGSATGYYDLWDPVAAASGLSADQQIAAWKEIGVIALAYKHVLGRQPTPAETQGDVAALKSGTTWKQLWRRLAQSPERESRFGYWAPAPMPASEAPAVFGIASGSQQCFGGLGPKCAGGIPEVVNGKVAPAWSGSFRLPDNTSMGYVSIGVAVGSILHDNACLRDMSGLNCNGVGAGDLIKIGGFPAVMEWNKAAWNVIDQRTWRETFGPYPTDQAQREAEWYDDIRPVPNRISMMAPVLSMLAFPGLTESYRGGETRRSRALKAPANTSVDDTDVQFCGSGGFASQGAFPLKASWGICR